jgi:hypothetical protein
MWGMPTNAKDEDPLAQAQRWRARAEELRVIADTLHGETREALLEAADEWVRMAEQTERLHRAEK